MIKVKVHSCKSSGDGWGNAEQGKELLWWRIGLGVQGRMEMSASLGGEAGTCHLCLGVGWSQPAVVCTVNSRLDAILRAVGNLWGKNGPWFGQLCSTGSEDLRSG